MNNENVGVVINMSGGGSRSGPVKLANISVTKPPNKTAYRSGEAFDPTGMVVSADYGFGITSDVTGYIVAPSVLTDGVSEVTITYTEGRITKTASVSVTVSKVLTHIDVTTPPTKTVYNYQESFDPAGMVVTAYFSDGSDSVAAGYSYPATLFSTLGQQTVNLDYTYEGDTKSASLEVTVNAIQMAVPTQKNIPSYDGTSKVPAWNGYDSVKMAMDGDTFGVNAKRDYAVTFTLIYGYVFPNGASEATVTWAIDHAVIAALPAQSNVLAADGTSKFPTWDGYDSTQLIIGGATSGTDAGDYTATFTPTDNYEWWDGTTGAKDAAWTITSVIVPIPTQAGSLTYTGAVQTPQWDNFDVENSSVQVTPAADAGEHSATFTLLQGMWSDGTTANKIVKWVIGRATIAAVPAQSGIPKYDGNPKTPTWDANYDSAKMTVSVEAQINAGTGYPASFTPTANYQWPDESIGPKSAVWAIDMGMGSLTLSTTEVMLDKSHPTASFEVTRAGDGRITAVSSEISVATVSVNGTTVTVNSVNEANGSAVITVTVAEGTNYTAPASASCQVTASFAIIYGVEWDGSASTKLARTDAAALFTDPVPAVNNGTGSSPFDSIMPWAGMKRVTDAQAGELVEIPKFWYKLTKNGDALKIQISPDPVTGFSVSPAHMDRGDGKGERDKVYIGRYHCTSTYKSTTKVRPVANITRATARTNIHKLGTTIWQWDFAAKFTVQLLYIVEFANWDSQACIGRGCGYGGIQNAGNSDAMQYHTGTPVANRATNSWGLQYRWIEGLWDNVYDWLDGCTAFYNEGFCVILNPNSFSDSKGMGIKAYQNVYCTPGVIALDISSLAGFPLFYPSADVYNASNIPIPDGWQIRSNNGFVFVGGWSVSGDTIVTLINEAGIFNIKSTDRNETTIGTRLMKLP